jgi:quercetin dioxygenase-like cupin family protein
MEQRDIDLVQLTGLLGEGEQFVREVYYEQLYEFLPKDPTTHVQLYVAEVAAGGDTGWHAHNGAGLFLITHGVVRVEHRDTGEVNEYRKSDVFFEPIGLVHRGVNPDPDRPYGAIGIRFTSPGRPTDIYLDAEAPVPNRPARR